MDLRNLNTFVQVAELNSFTRAAEKLGCSQPTVSLQIKQLEQEMGVQLFERIGHTVSLTDAGHNALAYAQRICQLSQEMAADATHPQVPSGIIRIAMADSLCAPLIINCFDEFHKLYPAISLHVIAAGTAEMFRLLDHNEVDIVCTLDEHIYNSTYIIACEEKIDVHFVSSTNHRLAVLNTLTLEDVVTEPFLLTERGMSYRSQLDQALARNSMEIKPMLEIGRPDLICTLVEQNLGLSFLPDYVTEQAVQEKRITRLPVQDINGELWIQLLYHRDKWISHPMHIFLDHLSEKLRLIPSSH